MKVSPSENAAPAAGPFRWWHLIAGRRLLLTLGRLALLYVLVVALVYWFQDGLLYHPTRISPETELANVASGRYQPFYGQPGTPEFRGWLQKYENPMPGGEDVAKGTVVVAHGNAGLAIWSHHYGGMLEPAGYNVMLYEYPGYASRDGRPSEATIVSDLRETVRRLDAEGLGPVFLLGESLGCGVVASAAADPTLPVAGIFLGTPWDTLPDLAASRFWFLPARYLVRDQYDSVGNLAGFDGPVFIVLAANDRVIPPRFGQRLYDSLPGEKRMETFNAGHNNWFGQTDSRWWREVMAFLSGEGQTQVTMEAAQPASSEKASRTKIPVR
ncbi:MAG: alpha/beta fold hydrolase [Verrucomicrobiota bacterium]